MQKFNKEAYAALVKKRANRSPVVKNCLFAFLTGGTLCLAAEGLSHLYFSFGWGEKVAAPMVTVTMIFFAALLTLFGVFDRIARFAGAGTLLPVTGFANAVVSPAMDNKSEGYVMGVGAKMFTVAGPVIVYGTAAAVIYGIIYWITTLF